MTDDPILPDSIAQMIATKIRSALTNLGFDKPATTPDIPESCWVHMRPFLPSVIEKQPTHSNLLIDLKDMRLLAQAHARTPPFHVIAQTMREAEKSLPEDTALFQKFLRT